MTLDPVRLLDDPESPAELRADLARTVDLGGAGYGVGVVAKSGMLVKLALLAGGGAVAVGLVFWAIHTRQPAPITPSAAIATAVVAPVVETVTPPEPVVAIVAQPSPVAVVASKSAVRVDVDPHAELAQLTRIRQLVATDPTAALAGVAEGDKTFARGQLQQERAIVAIDALDKLGRHGEAQSRAHAFLAAHGESAYAAHVRSIAEREK